MSHDDDHGMVTLSDGYQFHAHGGLDDCEHDFRGLDDQGNHWCRKCGRWHDGHEPDHGAECDDEWDEGIAP